jgi:drug/metabolite transporter (DMT)-like permease
VSLAVLFALAGAGFSATNDLIYRKASEVSRETNPLHFTLVASVTSSLAALVLSLVLSLTSSKGFSVLSFGVVDLVYGAIAGVISFIGYLLYLLSFTGDNTSVSVTVFRMSMIPSVVYAMLFMGEAASLQRSVAIVLCVLSVVLLGSWKSGAHAGRRALWLGIGACLAIASLNEVNKMAITLGGDSFHLMGVRFAVAALLTCALLLLRRTGRLDRRILVYAVSSGLALMMGIYCILAGMRAGDIGLVLPITSLAFPLVAVASWVFFKETATPLKIGGVLLAVGAVLLIR